MFFTGAFTLSNVSAFIGEFAIINAFTIVKCFFTGAFTILEFKCFNWYVHNYQVLLVVRSRSRIESSFLLVECLF